MRGRQLPQQLPSGLTSTAVCHITIPNVLPESGVAAFGNRGNIQQDLFVPWLQFCKAAQHFFVVTCAAAVKFIGSKCSLQCYNLA
jgi:hypothetical protein